MRIIKSELYHTTECDGIGWYEYGSIKAFDKGTSWIEGLITLSTDAHSIDELTEWANSDGVDIIYDALEKEVVQFDDVQWSEREFFRNKDGFYCVEAGFTAPVLEFTKEYEPDY